MSTDSSAATGEGPFRTSARDELVSLLWQPSSPGALRYALHPAYMAGISLVTLVSLWFFVEEAGFLYVNALALPAFMVLMRAFSSKHPRPVPCQLGPEGIRCERPDRTSEWSFALVRSVLARGGLVQVSLADGELLELRPASSAQELARWIRSQSPGLDGVDHGQRQLAVGLFYMVFCPLMLALVAHLA